MSIIEKLVLPGILLLVFLYVLSKGIRIIQFQMDYILYMIQTNRDRGHYK